MDTVILGVSIALGTLPQWVSAVAAAVVVLAGAWLFFHSGRRVDLDIATTATLRDENVFLDIRLKMRPVGSYQVRPYRNSGACTVCNKQPRIQRTGEETWFAIERCSQQALATAYAAGDLHLPRFLTRGGGLVKRRARWGCPNRKMPSVEIWETTLQATDGDPAKVRLTDEALTGIITDPFAGQFAEPGETLQTSHLIPVNPAIEHLIGWRIRFSVSVPRATWFYRKPDRDSWGWTDDDFIAIPANDACSEAPPAEVVAPAPSTVE
jgi:hypothetical protein